jgi:dipeptidyl aminopeptidase/acylaminoacyl peptidase
MRTVLALALFSSALIAQKRPITHEDVWLMKRVGAPAVSPDGKWAVTSVTEPSYDAAKTVSDLWLVSLDGSTPPRRLTSTLAPESGAVFSPDSKRLAFATKREGDETTQIYILPLEGEKPCGSPIFRKVATDRKARKYNLRVFDSFPIRYWDHWLDDLRPHVFAQGLEAGATARDLLAGTRSSSRTGTTGS